MATTIMLDRVAPVSREQTRALVKATGAKAWAFYLGGAGHRRDKSAYDAGSLRMLADEGLALVPIYVGRQRDLSHARGVADAKKAVDRHEQMGSHGDLIFADVERSASDPDLPAAARYLSGFAEELHRNGLRAGLYGAFELPGAVAKHADESPDVAWIARYLVNTKTEFPDPKAMRAKYPADPRDVKGVDRTHFAKPGQRGWQFFGDVMVTGVQIDLSVVDPAMLKAKKAAPAKPAKPATPSTPTKPATKPAAPTAGTITVRSGDTLSALEAKHGLPRGRLFELNAEALDDTAQQRGFDDSRNGSLIFPGQVLRTS